MRYVLIYGGIAGAIVIAVIVASLLVSLPNHMNSEWFGYLVMLAALSLIFIGVKRYRDVEGGGVIRFGRALSLGLGMAVVASVIYVAGWELYLGVSGRDFMADYAAATLRELRAGGASDAELSAAAAEMNQARQIYAQAPLRLMVTFSEIFPVGLLMAVVSALLLRNPRVMPARIA